MEILAIDVNRGRAEGVEGVEKIVSHYGASSTSELLDVVGFLEGLLLFSSSIDRLDGNLHGGTEAFGSDGQASTGAERSLFDVGRALWVVSRLSLHPNIIVCIITEKNVVSRHVTERNLLGLGRLLEDMVALLGLGRLDRVVQHAGTVLASPLSRLRRQLRNPLALTYGASRVHLPADVGESLLRIAKHYGVEFGLWRGGLCVFSCFSEERWLGVLGSFMLGDGVELIELSEMSEPSKMATGDTSIALDGYEVGVIRVKEFVLFATASHNGIPPQDGNIAVVAKVDSSDLGLLAEEVGSITSDFVACVGGWRRVDTRHVAGSRYCVESGHMGLITCSPRGKVSASSHHVRSMATALVDSLDSLDSTDPGHKTSCIYTCDKSGDTWACFTGDESTRALSVTLGGLAKLDVNLAGHRHTACVGRALDHREDAQNDRRRYGDI